MNLKERIFGGGVKGADSRDPSYKGSIQEWIPVKNILKGMVCTKDGRFVKILEVLPVNFYMLSELERKNIIYYFASYLKVAPDNLQMVVRTSKADLEDYVSMMRRYYEAEANEQCREMIEDNIREVQRVASIEAITHRFFLVFAYEPRMRARGNSVGSIADRLSEEAETARRYLDMCGLEVLEPRYTDNMVLDVLYEALNKKTSRHVKLPEGVFDMLTEVHGVYE